MLSILIYLFPYQSQVQSTEIVCSDCGKKYKSSGGYRRHRNTKHNDQQQRLSLTPSVLAEIVNDAVQKVKENKVFNADLRGEFSKYEYIQLTETEGFSVFKELYGGYLKNGDTEKFYEKYYAQVPLKSTSFFRGLSRNAATLLAIKVADSMLAHCKRMKSSPVNSILSSKTALSEKETASLQYLGGYVLQNLHKKCARKSSSESQQAMAILKAGKLENGCDSQKLVSSLSRGGLWSITEPAQKVFSRTEHYFRQSTLKVATTLQRVDIAGIAKKSVSDSDVVSNYQTMVSNAELVPTKNISKDVLHSIVNLYIRVRSFSLTKDIIQDFKIKTKQAKSKALRKEIQRSCHEHTQERQN